ncbi:CAP domain-containing protein Ecym_6325 [Eremothecium cymbalariae DBVPG|uniref:SCP domain-containing protein n=1 Tax=Eremothecium cymbalariae (strain CBS 270.75 / DBVPG 7215 / KCTC 17166 / NRRL Y-17582) TaxID=931890 RepID=G8JUC1_ERECY|nr:hypothetical protein Ecym_6325 [Eremothecium cymbalariae DBVPG\
MKLSQLVVSGASLLALASAAQPGLERRGNKNNIMVVFGEVYVRGSNTYTKYTSFFTDSVPSLTDPPKLSLDPEPSSEPETPEEQVQSSNDVKSMFTTTEYKQRTTYYPVESLPKSASSSAAPSSAPMSETSASVEQPSENAKPTLPSPSPSPSPSSPSPSPSSPSPSPSSPSPSPSSPSPSPSSPSPSPSSPSSSSSSPPRSSSSSQPSSDFQSTLLTAHNDKRRLHKDTSTLTWSDKLAQYAQNYADQYDCSGNLVHSNGGYGENLAVGYPNFKDAVDAWYDEIREYSFSNPTFSRSTGHFTQLVWKSTSQVGCGFKTCGPTVGTYLICSYDPPGNYIGRFAANVLPADPSRRK